MCGVSRIIFSHMRKKGDAQKKRGREKPKRRERRGRLHASKNYFMGVELLISLIDTGVLAEKETERKRYGEGGGRVRLFSCKYVSYYIISTR